MPDTTAALLPILAFMASTAGAGWLASAAFARLRLGVPRPTAAQWPRLTLLGRLVITALYAPLWARVAVFVLAAAISLAATVGVAALTGQPARPALDAALAVIVSQIVHAAGLPATVEPQP